VWTAGALAAAVSSLAAGAFTSVEAEVQLLEIGGQPHAIIELFAVFTQTNDNVLNVFGTNYVLSGAPGYIHLDQVGQTWDPKASIPMGGQNPLDSLVRIGGSLGVPTNTTAADPNWGVAGFNQAGIPLAAGWFNSSPPNVQGQAGSDFKTPISRHIFQVPGPVTLSASAGLFYNSGTGTPAFQVSFSVSFEILPEGTPPNDDCAGAIPLALGVPKAYVTDDTTTDGPSACQGMAKDLWYTYVPSMTGFVQVSTCDSTFESLIAVYDGCGCPASLSTLLGCTICCCGPIGTSVTFPAVAGQCYLIQLGGEGGSTGTGTIVVEQSFTDCNANGIQDGYEIQFGLTADCDGNGQPDDCQLAFGDANGNGVLDLCETVPKPILGPVINPANCRRYYLLASSNWTLSRAAATALGGELVVINDEAENTWIWETFSPYTPAIWIGLSDLANEGQFVWEDRTPLVYSNWSPGEPNDFLGEDYVHQWAVGGPGKWNDARDLFYFGHGVVELPLGPDFNGDGVVDGADLGLILSAWGSDDPTFDLDCSGEVNGGDLGQVLAAWS